MLAKSALANMKIVTTANELQIRTAVAQAGCWTTDGKLEIKRGLHGFRESVLKDLLRGEVEARWDGSAAGSESSRRFSTSS